MNARNMLISGALLAALAVASGAFGAHWLRAELADRELPAEDRQRQLEVWDVAVRYQMYHAGGLLVLGVLSRPAPNRWLRVAAWLFVAGIAVFSGCLYALVLTGIKVLGAIVPLGGVAMMGGWVALAAGVARERAS